jgi:hypothetical protein
MARWLASESAPIRWRWFDAFAVGYLLAKLTRSLAHMREALTRGARDAL